MQPVFILFSIWIYYFVLLCQMVLASVLVAPGEIGYTFQENKI